MDLYSPVLCALVYCSPQFNKGFILDLLSGVKFLGILTSMFAAPQNSCDLSDIISNNSHRPESYFTIDSVINPSHSFQSLQLSETRCCCQDSHPSSLRSSCSPVFNHFEPVSLGALAEVVSRRKPSVSHLDIIPTRLFKELVDTLAPSVPSIINTSLLTGTAPADFKHATVQPVLIKDSSVTPFGVQSPGGNGLPSAPGFSDFCNTRQL